MDLIKLHNNLKSIDVVEIMVRALEDLDKFISDLNRDQLAKGQLSTGDNITPEYEDITKDIKSRKSGLSGVIDHVTLFDTGAFHGSIFTEIFPDEIIIDATDGKLDELEDKYTDDILGLTKENITKLKNKVLPIFWRKLNEQIYR